MANRKLAYTDDYKNKCFIEWYTNKRPSSPAKTREIIPMDEKGRKPNYPMLSRWMKELEWNERADEMDAKAMILVEDVLVNQKAEMLKRQAMDAFVLANAAREHLLNSGFDSSASAVNAYFKATEEERLTHGLDDFFKKVAEMSNSELEQEIIKMTRRAEDSGTLVLEAEEIEDKKENNSEKTDMTD